MPSGPLQKVIHIKKKTAKAVFSTNKKPETRFSGRPSSTPA